MTCARSPGERSEYEVGYGRPPVQHRFVKGQSGNPSGRGARKKTDKERDPFLKVLNRVAQEDIEITINGKRKKTTMLEAVIIRTFQQALAGKQDAVRTILSYFGDVDAWVKRNPDFPTGLDLDALAKDPIEIAKAYKRLLHANGS